MKKTKRQQISEARLEGYNRQASVDLYVSKRGLRTGSAAAFAVASVALGAPDTAHASIIYTTPTNLFAGMTHTNSLQDALLSVDVDGDGNADFALEVSWLFANFHQAFVENGQFALNHSVIGPSLPFTAALSLVFSSAGGGNSLGFRFQPGGANHVDYGWMKIRDSSGLQRDDLYYGYYADIRELAYDDSGAPIQFGDQGAPPPDTPEPGTLSMLSGIGLLALGAAGRRELQRRRTRA